MPGIRHGESVIVVDYSECGLPALIHTCGDMSPHSKNTQHWQI